MQHFKSNFGRISINSILISLLIATGHAQTTKWMSVGSFQSWYSSQGGEIEEGRVYDMQDGARWPAIYPNQDNAVAKGFWIGTTNYKDADGKTYAHKIVHRSLFFSN